MGVLDDILYQLIPGQNVNAASRNNTRTTSGLQPAQLSPDAFSQYNYDPNSNAYGRMNDVAQTIADQRAYADQQYSMAQAQKAQDALMRRLQAAQAAARNNNYGNSPQIPTGGRNPSLTGPVHLPVISPGGNVMPPLVAPPSPNSSGMNGQWNRWAGWNDLYGGPRTTPQTTLRNG